MMKISDCSGKLSTGYKWQLGMENGEAIALIWAENAAGNMDCMPDYMGNLSEEEQEELTGLACYRLPEMVKAVGKEYGEAWFADFIAPDMDEWAGIDPDTGYEEFVQALTAANHPPFVSDGDWEVEAADLLEGTPEELADFLDFGIGDELRAIFTDAAEDAAWDAFVEEKAKA